MALSRITTIIFRASLAVAVAVTMYLAITPEESLVVNNLNDKVNHILAFFVLAFLADYSAPKIRFNLTKVILISGYGLLIEAVQYFLPYREFSLLDLGANVFGIAAYALSQPALSRFYLLRRR